MEELPIPAPAVYQQHKTIRYLVYFLIVLVVALVVIVTIVSLQEKRLLSSFQITPGLFGNAFIGSRYNELVESGLKTKNKEQQFGELTKAFMLLSADYNLKPVSSKRAVLEKFADYLQQEFPNDWQKLNLTTPCKEEACGATARYTPEIEGLKQGIEASPGLGEDVRSIMLVDLENAAYANGRGDSSDMYKWLYGVFLNLRTFWRDSQDLNVKNLAERVLAIMQSTDSNLFSKGQAKNLYAL